MNNDQFNNDQAILKFQEDSLGYCMVIGSWSLVIHTLPMDHISSLIPSVLRKRGLYDEAQASMVVFRAKKWLQEHRPNEASSLEPKRLTGDILVIEAAHSLSVEEQSLLVAELLPFLRAEDSGALKEIRFTKA